MIIDVDRIKKYLLKLGVYCQELKTVDLKTKLPLSFAASSSATWVEIQGRRYVLAIPRNPNLEPTFVSALYHMIKDGFAADVIIGLEIADRDFCLFLREKQVNYIVPQRQIYIPPTMVFESDRAYSDKATLSLRMRLSSRAQQVLLWQLVYNRELSEIPYEFLIKSLNLKPEEVSLAARELRRHRICEIVRREKNASIVFLWSQAELWRRSQTLMFNPCRRMVRGKYAPLGALRAGLSALAERSEIVYNGPACLAAYDTEENVLPDEAVSLYDGLSIEYWRYDPRRFSKDGRSVDVFSLYLSLKDNVDARVQKALLQMVGEELHG